MPPHPSPRERALDFMDWRKKRHRARHLPKRKPSPWWDRMAARAAAEVSPLAVLIATRLGGFHA